MCRCTAAFVSANSSSVWTWLGLGFNLVWMLAKTHAGHWLTDLRRALFWVALLLIKRNFGLDKAA